jgi:queuine/archaeosine tRNA-ribosyltransferase
MNKRIKELAEQATVFVADYDGQRWQIDPEKFAELIVRECVDIAYKFDEPKLSGPGMIIGNRIEEHFGVEE